MVRRVNGFDECSALGSTSLFALAVVVTLSMAVSGQATADAACLRLASTVTFSQHFQPTAPSLKRWFSNACVYAGYTRIPQLQCSRADYRGFRVVDAFSGVGVDVHRFCHRPVIELEMLSMFWSFGAPPGSGRFFVLPPPTVC